METTKEKVVEKKEIKKVQDQETNLEELENELTEEEEKSGIFYGIHNGIQGKFKIKESEIDDLDESDFLYSEMFNKCLKRKLATEAKMLELLIESGDWTVKDEEKISKFQNECAENREIILEIRSKEKPSKQEKLQVKELIEITKEKREELFGMRNNRGSFLNHTAEAKSEETRRQYLTARSTFKVSDDGNEELVWKDYISYRKDFDGMFKLQAYLRYMGHQAGISGDIMKSFAEEQPNNWDQDNKKEKEKK